MSFLLICGLASAAAAQGPVDLPDDVQEAISGRWREAVAPAPLPSACAGSDGAPLPVINTDLDNDGHGDYVLIVRTADGPRLTAVLYRPWRFEIFELDSFEEQAAGSVSLEGRGTRFTPVGAIDDFFPAPTVVVRHCDGSAVAYLWSGAAFRRTPIAQSGARQDVVKRR